MDETVRFSEEALWDLYQFVKFNQHAMHNVRAALAALAAKKSIVYPVDYSEIHPALYPERAKQDLEEDDMALHSRSVKYLWESLLAQNLAELPFRLAIGPATRLEIIEGFWHAERRVSARYEQYIPMEVRRHLLISPAGIHVKNFAELSQAIAALNHAKFRPGLKAVTSDEALDRQVRQPAQKLLELMDGGVLLPLEEVLPPGTLNAAMSRGPSDEMVKTLERFFSQNPRARGEVTSWSPKHEYFHDLIDVYSLCLTHFLRYGPGQGSLYAALITHTFRVIAASKRIAAAPTDALAHHSIAPLYLARAIVVEGKDRLEHFFGAGHILADKLANELEAHTTIQHLKRIGRKARFARFEDGRQRLAEVSGRTYQRVVFMVSEYYGIVDTSVLLPAAEEADREPPVAQAEGVDVEDIVDLVRRKHHVVSEVRRYTKKVVARLGRPDDGLGGLYSPKSDFTKDVSDWLDEL